jgi:hypothetical protein
VNGTGDAAPASRLASEPASLARGRGICVFGGGKFSGDGTFGHTHFKCKEESSLVGNFKLKFSAIIFQRNSTVKNIRGRCMTQPRSRGSHL